VVRLVHTSLGSSYLKAHVLHDPPPPTRTALYYRLRVTTVCVYYCSTYYKTVREGGGGDGGHVLRETTSRGRCELVCPSRTNERGGEGYCVKEGGGEEGEREGACRGGATIYVFPTVIFHALFEQ